MAFLGQEVTVADLPEGSDFSPLPAGAYTVMITNSEMKETNAGTGQYILLEMDVQDGEYQGRKIFDRLNVQNPNEKAVEIAWQRVGEISRAVGLEKVKDSEQWHNKRLVVELSVEVGKDYVKDGQTVQGRPQNNVKKYRAYGQEQAAPVAASSTGAPAATNTRPWKKQA